MASKALISIVDDDESVREAMKGLMRSLGLSAETFSSAEEFLTSNSLAHTACLIADVQMSGMSGFNLHRRLVSSGRPIPTILITAYPDQRMRTHALRSGVIDYLKKPVNENELLDCLSKVLGQTPTRS